MLRVVLAVLLAVALLGVAMPVVEDARADRTSTLAAGELSRLAERATGLAASGETGPDAASRRTVDLSLPAGGFATAPLAYAAVGGLPDCDAPGDTAAGDVVAYRLVGGDTRVRHVPVDVRVVEAGQVRDDDEPLVLRGDASLTLALVETGGTRTVLVGRTGTVEGAAVEPAAGGRGA